MDDIDDEIMGVGKVKIPDLRPNFYEVEEDHWKKDREAESEVK